MWSSIAKWFTSRNLFPQPLLRPQGFGETQPRFPNTTQNRAKNRRVEIIMLNS